MKFYSSPMIIHAPVPSRHVLTSMENHMGSEETTADYGRQVDYDEINYREEESSPHSSEEARSCGNYRAELKRPDLKGSFRCSICGKVFCHSSSLSRHRMQAHFKSYKCTLCRKDITSNETLRTHMYKQHQISRMFMCRCCNWAFPDKTSLHMHIQAREEGKTIQVPVIGKGLAPGDPADRSAFASIPMGAQLGPMPPPGTLAPQPLPFFTPAPPPAQLPPSQEEISRIRDRLMLNQLMAQPPFALPWLNQLPKPIPTTRPLDVFPKQEEMEINVEKDDQSNKSDYDDKSNIFGSDTDEPKSEGCVKTESPCTRSSTSSGSPTSSPVNLFKKDSREPSAFHHLCVDSTRPNFISPHVSPAETHSSASPDGHHHCFDCAVSKTKQTMAENKCRYLESRANTLQTEAVRAQSSSTAAEAALRVMETEVRNLRDMTEQLQRRLLDCQEQALRFVQSDRTANPQAVVLFLNQLIQSSIIR